MPEIPKWVIVLIVVIAGCWFINQATSFVSKVNTTVGKANSSMEREQNTLQHMGE